jgi:hypothetical protein
MMAAFLSTDKAALDALETGADPTEPAKIQSIYLCKT